MVLFGCHKSEESEILKLKIVNILKDTHSKKTTTEFEYVCGKIYQTNIVIEEVNILTNTLRKQWHFLQSNLFTNTNTLHTNVITTREQINEVLMLLLDSLCSYSCHSKLLQEEYHKTTIKHLEPLFKLTVPICDFEETVVQKIARIQASNNRCPYYNYLHCYLELQCFKLLIYFTCKNSPENIKKCVRTIFIDLIHLSFYTYKSLSNKVTCPCSCVKSFWLILYLFMKLHIHNESFWDIFNEIVKGKEPLFVLYLLKDICTSRKNNLHFDILQEDIEENSGLLEINLKNYLASDPGDKNSVLDCLKCISELVGDLWLKSAKIETFQILWEYYSKKLNIPYNFDVLSCSIIQYEEFVDKIVWYSSDCTDDFSYFIGMLLSHLKEHPTHWNKIKGRIYSSLNPHKTKELTDYGIFKVFVLYFALMCFNFDELLKRIGPVFQNLPPEKKKTIYVWNIYIYLIVKHVRDARTIEKISPFMVDLLQEAVNDTKHFKLLKIFISSFEHVINSSSNMQLNQWTLFNNTWLHKYMLTCSISELINITNVLDLTINRIKQENAVSDWENTFKEFVYPSVKQVSNSNSSPSVIGKLAGRITLLYPSLFTETFTYYNSENMPAKICYEYLKIILEDYPNNILLTSAQEMFVLQSWVKICLFSSEDHSLLTENISKFDCVPVAMKNKITVTQDAFCGFIEYLSQDLKQNIHSNIIDKLCENCFGQTDRWIMQYFLQPENEAIVLRIYTCMALAFFHCGALLYNRNKSACPLTRLITSLLLPMEFMMGKPLHPFMLNCVKKTWHLYFEAIVKLNSNNDLFLERVLRDMIVKYIPYMTSTDSLIIKSLENDLTAGTVLDKLSVAFFKHPVKECDTSMLKALKIIQDFVRSTTSINGFKLVITKALYGLFEVVLFHNQRNAAVSVIKDIINSPLYRQVKIEFGEIILAITKKHLAFNTVNYFHLMVTLAKLIPNDIKLIMTDIKAQVLNIEKMRGVGFDKNLRQHLEKLENLLE